jgi:hypothetical protein
MQQFRQCCVLLGLVGSETEMASVAAKFTDDQGFNYYRFMSEIQPPIVEPPKYSKFQQELADLNSTKVLDEFRPAFDLQSVLQKIKDTVSGPEYNSRQIKFRQLILKNKKEKN